VAARALPVLLLLLGAPVLAGDAPETDPFLAALAGRSGPDAVAAPSFDPDLEAVSWSLRPRREIVDALAARLLRGEAKGWSEPAKETPVLPAPPSRVPADFEPGKVEITDRLAAWVPADAAVVFLGSLGEAQDAVAALAKFLPEAFPGLCGDPPGGRRDALRRATEMLLLPTIWNSNPAARTGTRQVALVVSDPDVRWAPDIALLCEVDDATLVRSQRQATFSWEGRRPTGLRVEGLDAVSDDGSIRSFFALEGGIALWSTTRSLRERILAAGAGKAPALAAPPAKEYALARRTFPAAEGGALLLVPDAFLARVSAAKFRARRAAALRCEAVRLLLDAQTFATATEPGAGMGRPECPVGGVLQSRAGGAGSSCGLHGVAGNAVPLGDLPSAATLECDATSMRADARPDDWIREGLVPAAIRWKAAPLEVLPPFPSNAAVMRFLDQVLQAIEYSPRSDGQRAERRRSLLDRILRMDQRESVLEQLTGLGPVEARPLPSLDHPRPEETFRIVGPR
jgi:hypothetical protein